MRTKTMAAAWLEALQQRWRVWARGWRRSRPRQLRLCETLSLGERRFLAVVQFEQQRFLLGGTGSSIALLAQLPGGGPAGEAKREEV